MHCPKRDAAGASRRLLPGTRFAAGRVQLLWSEDGVGQVGHEHLASVTICRHFVCGQRMHSRVRSEKNATRGIMQVTRQP
jgi:hypothetical protein